MSHALRTLAFALLLGIASLWLPGCITVNPSLLGGGSQAMQEVELGGTGESKVLMIVIEGSITSSDSRSILGGSSNTVDDVRRQLDRARLDPSIEALLLRINSPGGGATASDTIFHEIERYKLDTGVPVIAFFQDLAASGGYYIAMAADVIIAQPTTITGSIGVISTFITVEGLMSEVGVKAEVFKSADMKGAGMPFEDLTDKQREHMQAMTMKFYDTFVERVATGRPRLAESRIRQLADGRVYMADEALDNGLIDQIGYFEDAYEVALNFADLSRARLVNYSVVVSDSDRSIYTKPRVETEFNASLRITDGLGMLRAGPGFYYLWQE